MSKGKKIALPATIIECPEMKVFAVRFYKNNTVAKDIIVGFDDELKSKVKKPKKIESELNFTDFDDIRVLAYSHVKKTGIQKTPDVVEFALAGKKEDKLKFVKEKIGKEISVSEVFSDGLVDVHGVTRGRGLQGPVRRFGISLKFHKTEKGQRRPGTLGPWHPARVTFRVAQAGQTGFQTRVAYNNLILQIKNIKDSNINRSGGFHKYGNIKTSYLILKGSIPGPQKRPILMVPAIRPSKKTVKQKYEVLDIR
jgi:large subunit ribosomal protein L3